MLLHVSETLSILDISITKFLSFMLVEEMINLKKIMLAMAYKPSLRNSDIMKKN